MQASLKKFELPTLGLLFIALFWLLLGIKLKVESKIYSDIIFPIKSLLDIHPNTNIDVAQIEVFRNQVLDSVNFVFLLIITMGFFVIYSGSYTRIQKLISYSGIFFLSALFIILPRIT